MDKRGITWNASFSALAKRNVRLSNIVLPGLARSKSRDGNVHPFKSYNLVTLLGGLLICSGVSFLLLNFRFEDYFANRVKQLIYTFPEDATTSSGTPFWSAPKRFPSPLQFSTSDPTHLHFVLAASILRAEIYGITVPDWVKNPKKFAEAVERAEVPEFQPKEGVKIETDEKATNANSAASLDDSLVIDELITKLEHCRANLDPGFNIKPIHFEKVCISSVIKSFNVFHNSYRL